MQELSYKYIILSCGLGDYYDYAYRQINEIDGNLYDGNFPWNKFWETINRIHFSNKLNNYINLPFKKIWIFAYLCYIRKKVKSVAKKDDKICFVFFRTWFLTGLLQQGLATLLRKKYPKCKIVFYIQDQARVSGIPLSVMVNNSDLMIYYDKDDALNYGGKHYDVPYSAIGEFIKDSKEINKDVYFVGNAKNRYDDIICAYETLTAKGLVCDFNIMGVPKEKRLYEDSINYEKVLSYKENLEKVGSSRCVLEIIQKESTGNTLRVYEAIMLDKLLLSNNAALKDNGWYDEKYMLVYDDVNSIDVNFIRNSKNVCYQNKKNLYPENLLYFIEKNLTEE